MKSKIVYQCNVGVLLLISTAMGTLSWGASNNITQVFYHQGIFADKIVCYLTDVPVCNRLPSSFKANPSSAFDQELVLFMPYTRIGTSEAQQAVKQLNLTRHPSYCVQVEEVRSPTTGIKIVIAYDSKTIAYEHELFQAISTKQGMVIHLYNKQALNDLKHKTEPLLRFACNGTKPRIMLDCGHGGKDSGKIGINNIAEKDITLQVGLKVAQCLRQEGYEVLLTRRRDVYISLDERTSTTNKQRADLFVSIHANGAPLSEASGIETFWMNRGLMRKSYRKIDSQTQNILTDFHSRLDKENKTLAQQIHTTVLAYTKNYNVVDRKIKQSVSQVLLGTDVPSALIEIGFLSNQHEAQRLATPSYQRALACGICNGIKQYCAQVFCA